MSVAARKAEADELFRAGRHQEAVLAYGGALSLAEERRDASLLHLLYANRAAALLALKEWQAALADALSSVAVDDSYAKGHYRAAVALQKLGRAPDALRHAARAAALDSASRDAAALLLRLQAGSTAPGPGAASSSGEQQQQRAGAAGAVGVKSGARVGAGAGPLTQARALALVPVAMRGGSRYVASRDGGDANVLVLCHGLGDKPDRFAALAQHMALPQTTALALAGRLEIPMSDGGRAWFTAFDEEFNLIAPSPNETRRAASLAETVELILPLLAALSGSDGAEESGGAAAVEEGLQRAPRRRVHLFGFSQGGTVVLEIARRLCGGSWADAVADSGGGGGGSGTGSAGCRAPAWLGSVVAVSASLLEERLPALEREQRGRDGAAAAGGVAGAQASVAGAAGGFMPRAVPVLITHGDRDEVVPRKAVERSAALLREAGCDVSLHRVAGKGHAMVGPDKAEAGALLQFYGGALAAAPPGEGFVEVVAPAGSVGGGG